MIMVKKSPEWAPKELIATLEAHHRYASLKTDSMEDKTLSFMLENSTNIEACSGGQKQEHLERYREAYSLLPHAELIEILEELLTGYEMRAAWTSLGKVFKDDSDYRFFWIACMEAITGGRKMYRRSGAEHRKHFQKINKCASTLSQLLDETTEMYSFPVTELISDDRINRLRENLRVPPESSAQHARSYLDGVIPNIQAILHNIAVKAEKISKEELLVKKPNSKTSETTKKAEIHYFIRYLSRYLKDEYHKPLHEVVAATARVVFNDLEIDVDYVRQLTRNL
jgi:hypothetical protein